MSTPAPFSLHTRNRAMGIAIALFLSLGLIWALYYWTYGRFYIYTDDAYVDGNQVMVTARVSSAIVSFSANDGDFVTQGRVLVELDKKDARIAVQKASAELAEQCREVARLFENVQRDCALVEARKAEFVKATQDYEHRKGLVEEGGVSVEDFEHAQAALDSSFFLLGAAEYQYNASIAQIENTTATTHPLVETAKSTLRDAWITFQRCSIKAPVSGIVAQRSLEVGEQIKVGQPLMAIVPLDQLWVTANFKETQLRRMRIGQPVIVHSDTYGDGVEFKGVVVGIGGGTGSAFSLLPPQNATGNWIKIVQRVPVRVALNQEWIKHYPLRLGLSTEVSVDTHNMLLPYIPESQAEVPLFETTIFADQEMDVDALIEQIMIQNLTTSKNE